MVFVSGVLTFSSCSSGANASPSGTVRCRGFYVRGKIILVTPGDGVFSGICQYVKFLRTVAANFSAVRIDHAKFQSKSLEYCRVGRVHDLVTLFQGRLINVK